MAPRLAADGLVFVGLDFIGGKLTEVNVTSPTGIQELSRHLGRDVAERRHRLGRAPRARGVAPPGSIAPAELERMPITVIVRLGGRRRRRA